MKEQTGVYTRQIGKTTYVIGPKPAEKSKGTLENKLKRMIQKENNESSKAE